MFGSVSCLEDPVLKVNNLSYIYFSYEKRVRFVFMQMEPVLMYLSLFLLHQGIAEKYKKTGSDCPALGHPEKHCCDS